jgi:acetyl-CoA carboxylase biotin carboxyl carrier protein
MAGSDPKRLPDDVFDLERIRELIELMKQHDLSEIDLRRDKHQIRLARQIGGTGLFGTSSGAGASAPPSAPTSTNTKLPESSAAGTTLTTINSPMVGTFYTRPNPDSSPFVKVGDVVGPETVVCIIEAMKVFNEIAAETAGKIVAVLVKDQDAVEFGTPLFRIDPNGA